MGRAEKQNEIIRKYSLKAKIIYLFISFIFIITSQTTFPSFAHEEVEDFDSVIAIPTERFQNLRRTRKMMYKKVKNDLVVIPLDKSKNKREQINKLKESNLFKIVEPDYKLFLDKRENKRTYTSINNHTISNSNQDNKTIPNDKDFIYQYYLKEINATEAWKTTTGSSLTVAVLDTGIDINHPDLSKIIIAEKDYINTIDDIGHGTEIAGIIAADTNNIEGIAGIAWNAKILPIKITNESGEASVSTVVEALEKAYEKGAKIVQISLGTKNYSEILEHAIQKSQDRGMLIISSGGNSGTYELRYPAAFKGVIGVGATGQNKKIEPYSTKGEHITLVAPGSFIYTTSLYSSYVQVTGTSFAAPQVAGIAALVWSIVPNLTSNDIREILTKSAYDLGDKGKDLIYGYGLLNAEEAINIAKNKTN